METDPEPVGDSSTNVLLWFALDLVCVLGFVVVGNLTHGTPLGEYLGTAWPFVVGLVVAWMAPGTRDVPTILWPTGVLVWAVTTVVGLGLRWASGDGLSGAFPLVTAAVLAVLLIGWRVVPEVLVRRRGRQARYL
ncbi:DUF3054 domain-containing protein [Georgenia yuyongxinii]|uniref:DUF3054 domain-containing protein n=1 Tax=Georgenia yuyongxinii TaxID=2589797 RepID=A0A5B8C0V2_9MICO|nr:DUF3054 domain-containing protein [Georgenia yuyongxinii]QDC24154.1 DUF3054 domain-containing protein [Georgenia yuyongxinii]